MFFHFHPATSHQGTNILNIDFFSSLFLPLLFNILYIFGFLEDEGDFFFGLEYERRKRSIQVPQRHLKEDLHCVSPYSTVYIFFSMSLLIHPQNNWTKTSHHCFYFISLRGLLLLTLCLLAAWRPWNETDKSSTNTTNTVTELPFKYNKTFTKNIHIILKRTGILFFWLVKCVFFMFHKGLTRVCWKTLFIPLLFHICMCLYILYLIFLSYFFSR